MNKMTHDEMLKYSAELVIKNNPDEALKLLVRLQVENEQLKDIIMKAIKEINRNKYMIDFGKVLEILRGEDNE